MKKFSVALFLGVILLSGCGKVSNSVSSLGRSSGDYAYVPPSAEGESYAGDFSFIEAVRGLLSDYVPNAAAASAGLPANKNAYDSAAGDIREGSALTADSLRASGFSTQAIEYVNDFNFWNEQIATKDYQGLRQVIEHKYRYHEKGAPDGVFIAKYVKDFEQADWDNYDYIEDLQIIHGYYANRPDKELFTLWYHNKIIYDKNTKTYYYTLMPDSTFPKGIYYNFVDAAHQPAEFRITDFDVEASAAGLTRGAATLRSGSSRCELDIKNYQADFFDDGAAYSGKNEMLTLKFADNKLQAKYYVGAGRPYGYIVNNEKKNQGENSIDGSITDYSTIEFYTDMAAVSLKSAGNKPLGERLREIILKPADGLTGVKINEDNKTSEVAEFTGLDKLSILKGLDFLSGIILDDTLLVDSEISSVTPKRNDGIILKNSSLERVTLNNIIGETSTTYYGLRIDGSTLNEVGIYNIEGNSSRGIYAGNGAQIKNTVIDGVKGKSHTAMHFDSAVYFEKTLLRNINSTGSRGMYLDKAQVTINNSTLENISGKPYGIHVLSGASLALDDTILNKVTGKTTSIYITGPSKFVVNNSIISDIGSGTWGVYIDNTNGVEFNNVTLSNIVDTDTGIAVLGSAKLLINNSVISDIGSGTYGFYTDTAAGSIKLNNVTFNNITNDGTYGIFFPDPSTELKNVTFSNIKNQTWGVSIWYAYLTDVTFENVENIYIDKPIGAKRLKGTITFKNCTFNGGWAPYDGYKSGTVYSGVHTYP
ncbi:MAG: right-handed parallel beta-helix repeat-containing protein [Candidatus Margulisbacteria bacterium]|nr:right-handed parallel beta-helix repeat-containing protein [Candidatus Margulisiibacteriota bacterium]